MSQAGNPKCVSAGLSAQLLVTVLIFLPIVGCQSSMSEREAADGENPGAGRYIVELVRPEGARSLLREALADWNPSVIEPLETERLLYRVELVEDPGPSAVKDRLSAQPGVIAIQPDYRYEGASGSGSPSPGSAYD